MDYLHSALQILNSVFCLQVNESIIPTTSLSALLSPRQLGLCCYWPQALGKLFLPTKEPAQQLRILNQL